MAFFACCVSPIVAFLCQPVMGELQNSLQTVARDLLNFARDWASREINGRFFSRPSPAEEVPVSSTEIIGAKETLQEIHSYLNDEKVASIGIWGMGGIGKTTLLQSINNYFCESGTRGMFDLVIWVTVSKEINIPEIQKQIGDRLSLSFSKSDETDVGEQANLLFKALSNKRFLLLLDDLWAPLDLVKIGIPKPEGRRNHKIAFTTRSSDVCSDMEAHESVRVGLLDDTRSWELFCSKVGAEAVLKSPTIQPLAKQVVHKCGGLPLALITVGKAMANRKLPNEWKHAINALDHSATELRGMDQVISALKFSYDNLESDKMRSALLFCAMYPEDTEIRREELIEYWVGEGLLDSDSDVDDDIDDARNRGHVLISDLQSACLLERGIKNAERGVRMHDAVRDMALWINSHEYDKVDGFLMLSTQKLARVCEIRGSEHVRRIWMQKMDLNACPSGIPNCPNAWTILLRGARLGSLHLQGLCNHMSALRVLDLSDVKIKELPKEIGLLVELQYLNLMWTRIKSLPKELGKLIRLRELNLELTRVSRIPREAIVGLSGLQVLNMWYTGYKWREDGKKTTLEGMSLVERLQRSSSLDDDDDDGGDDDAANRDDRQLEVSDLEGLVRLQELHIRLWTWQQLDRILRSDRLYRCISGLGLDGEALVDGLLQMALNKIGAHLTQLQLGGRHAPFAEELRFSLDEVPCLELLELRHFESRTTRVVLVGKVNPETKNSSGPAASSSNQCFHTLNIFSYGELKELKLVGRFPRLEEIYLANCDRVEKLVLGDDEDDGAAIGRSGRQEPFYSHFPMLRHVYLAHLPALESISQRPLHLPSLESIFVGRCRQLGRLPLGPGSAPKLTSIGGHQDWWDALEWGDGRDGGDAKTIYEPFFRSH